MSERDPREQQARLLDLLADSFRHGAKSAPDLSFVTDPNIAALQAGAAALRHQIAPSVGVDLRKRVLASVSTYVTRVADQGGSLDGTAALHGFVAHDVDRMIEAVRAESEIKIKQLQATLGGMKIGANGEIWKFRCETAEARVKELEALQRPSGATCDHNNGKGDGYQGTGRYCAECGAWWPSPPVPAPSEEEK